MTKEELKNYINIKKELEQIQFRIKELNEKKTAIKSVIISDMNVQTSHNNNSLETILIKIEECIEEYRKKEIELYEEQIKIEKCINSLETNERIIMRLRYFDGYKWEKVCVITNYSWEGIHKIHRKILKKIA